MSCCVICGGIISDLVQWMREFRAIYSTPDGGHFISGVGWFVEEEDEYLAPTDPTKRLDDEDCDPHSVNSFFLNIYEQGVHSFLIHSLCWSLLQEALRPNDIPLKRLLEVFDSLPLSSRPDCFNWGHTYGGFHGFSLEYNGLWEFDLKYNPADNESDGIYGENPYNVPQVFTLLSETSHGLQNSDIAHRNYHSCDCFGNLPWEIRESIAEHLSTQDALALRQSSRAFLPLLDSPIFWASRFLPGAEREFLFEKRKTPEIRDWLSLYRMTSLSQSPPGLKNRQRIWSLIEYIIQLLNLRLSNGCHTTTLGSSLSGDQSMDIAVSGYITTLPQLRSYGPGDPTYCVAREGCQAFWEQYASIPRDLTAIYVFFVGIENVGFISGLRFKSACGADTELGYSSAESQVVVNIECLNGFCLATSQLGIRALQVVGGDGKRSSWIGAPQDMLLTEHLALFDTTKPIRAKIDGYKLVALEAKRLGYASGDCALSTESLASLRTTALWYPSVPPPNVHLNESSFMGDEYIMRYLKARSWINFGGLGGRNLRHLEMVRLGTVEAIMPKEVLAVIGFNYSDSSSIDPIEIGYKGTERDIEMHSYPIDGPGGERIQTVQVAILGSNWGLKFVTNYGNSFGLGLPLQLLEEDTDPDEPCDIIARLPGGRLDLVDLHYDPSTTITGFYTWHGFACFESLGVVSEVVEDA